MRLDASRVAISTRIVCLVGFLQVSVPYGASGDQLDPCPTVPPPGYALEIGYGKGGESEALIAARQDATERLLEKTCSGLSEARCNGIRRAIRPWGDGAYKRSTRSACAAVAVEGSVIRQFEEDVVRFEQELETLAAQIVEQEVTLVHQEPPVWMSGCSAGDLGEYLRVALESQLGATGSVQITMGAERPRNAAVLRLRLAHGPRGVLVTALLQRPSKEGWLPLPGPSVSADLFGIDSSAGRQCASDEMLGLENTERVGVDGLQVRIEINGNVGQFCEGTEIEPIIRVNRRARVQVYNVQHDGQAHLVWPPPGGVATVDESISLGVFHLIQSPLPGDERLVAVALEHDGSFGARDGWTGYCRLPAEFGPDQYPLGAAVGTATFTVLRGRKGRCPDMPLARVEASEAEAPVCGE